MPPVNVEDIDRELRRRHKCLRFTPDLEKQFERDTGMQRSVALVIAGLIALAIYDLFLLNDHAIRPEVFAEALMIRIGLLTPVALLVLTIIGLGVSAALRESLMSAMVLLGMACSGWIFSMASSPNNTLDPFSFSLIVLGGNIVFSLRFPYAAASTLITLLMMAGFLAHYDAMDWDVKVFALMVAGATGVFTLASNYRLEASERKSYLLLLLEKLRADAALADNRTLQAMTNTDPLTGVANRRQFDLALSAAWASAGASNLGLLLIDVDNFKAYNDYYGHVLGDTVLKKVAAAMRAEIRMEPDLLARYGGEEFVAVLHNVDTEGAAHVAERLRVAVEACAIPHKAAGQRGFVTVSIGAIVIRPSEGGSMDEALQRADAAMYDAKRRGRNQISITAMAETMQGNTVTVG